MTPASCFKKSWDRSIKRMGKLCKAQKTQENTGQKGLDEVQHFVKHMIV